ncbi:hypothetical protein B0T22DRAFT_458623 [Podospora appendiculata]|uniref:Uncharacterized protein n=1 Tax=Podospora appendiculata TaxID=314037 RepID=A0AAE1CC37_9PEZI|nr:hypothetical protein B0T22DRAFT_458623 [Podospora appendiculata]
MPGQPTSHTRSVWCRSLSPEDTSLDDVFNSSHPCPSSYDDIADGKARYRHSNGRWLLEEIKRATTRSRKSRCLVCPDATMLTRQFWKANLPTPDTKGGPVSMRCTRRMCDTECSVEASALLEGLCSLPLTADMDNLRPCFPCDRANLMPLPVRPSRSHQASLGVSRTGLCRPSVEDANVIGTPFSSWDWLLGKPPSWLP